MADVDQDKLADKIAEKMMQRIYQEIGKSVITKLFWVGIALVIGAGVWFGLIKIPTPGG